MSRAIKRQSEAGENPDEIVQDVLDCLDREKPVRFDLPDGGRVHIDRPMPFLCVHCVEPEGAEAARAITSAHSSYLLAEDPDGALPLIRALAGAMTERFGAFVVVEIGELDLDNPGTSDSPYLPSFDLRLASTKDDAARKAAEAFRVAIEDVEVRYRSPSVSVESTEALDGLAARCRGDADALSIRFAPIYKRPEGGTYPDLLERVVAILFDCTLHGLRAFTEETGALDVPSHRALGRQVFVEAVRRLDDQIDDICSTFDFLPAVTPINSDAAWAEFRASGFDGTPRLIYRPLSVAVDEAKRRLYAISFDHLEDPVLEALYREKQFELDIQLTMLSARDSVRFREASRLLYGSVEPALLEAAEAILERTGAKSGARSGEGGEQGYADCHYLQREACRMIESYRQAYDGFDPQVEIRDDQPPGLMVSGPRLMISSSTNMTRARVEALLSHEIGVHLLTFFNGDVHGLKLFRSGLGGYEGVQEGLAVFAEYLVGGMTVGRLRLLAGRVVGCAAMLDGAEFPETFRLLTRRHGFSKVGAFNLTLRLYRSGGLAKDAIYLRGLVEVLDHLAEGGTLDPFWMGKIAAQHLPVIQELGMRGLLRPPPVRPLFLDRKDAQKRLAVARAGMAPIDMITE